MAEKSLRFARNMSWNALGYVLLAVVNFLAVPFLIRRLGMETYGLYIIMNAAANYLVLASFSVGSAVGKYVAQFQGSRDGRGLADTLRYGTWVYLAGGLGGGACLWLAAHFVAVRVFHIPEPLADRAVFVLRCAAGAAVFAALCNMATSVLQGLQRFDWYNVLVTGQNVLMTLGSLTLVAAGFGIRAMAAWYAALSVLVCAAGVIVVWRLLADYRQLPAGPGLRFGSFARFSLTFWLGALAAIVASQFDKIFIARQMSLMAVTYYAVPAGLLQRLQAVPSLVVSVVLPMVSELPHTTAAADLRRMYCKGMRFVLWVVLPVLMTLFAVMPQFLSLWLGGQFSDASCWPARLLVLAQLAFALNAMPNAAAAGRDKPEYVTLWAWGQALISVAAWRVLIPRYGLLGVAWGSLLAQVLPAALHVGLVNRRIVGLSLREYVAEVLFAPFASAALTVGVLLVAHAWADTWLRLVALVLLAVAVFYGSTWFLLNDEDRGLLRKYLRLAPVTR